RDRAYERRGSRNRESWLLAPPPAAFRAGYGRGAVPSPNSMRSVPMHAGGIAAPAPRAFLPRTTGFEVGWTTRPYNPGMVTEASQALDSRANVRRTLERHGIRPTAQRVRMAEV